MDETAAKLDALDIFSTEKAAAFLLAAALRLSWHYAAGDQMPKPTLARWRSFVSMATVRMEVMGMYSS